jgi:hypothetical protein
MSARDVLKFPAIFYNLLLIKGAEYAYRHHAESAVMSALLIAPPGTSKSLSVALYKQYHQIHDPNEFFMSEYLCTRSSEADRLEDQFRDAATFYTNHESDESEIDRVLVSVLLDEIGLANLHPTNPLKILDSVQDKGYELSRGSQEFTPLLILETSNYALDITIQNRSLLHCNGLPTNDEIAESYVLKAILPPFSRDEDPLSAWIHLGLDLRLNFEAFGVGVTELIKNARRHNIYACAILILDKFWDVGGGRPEITV